MVNKKNHHYRVGTHQWGISTPKNLLGFQSANGDALDVSTSFPFFHPKLKQ
ncbi:MAG: hypothetical protein LBH32_11650 [Dysgonamonadaceae bacterium]|jgi:hypothetical protein|nr:hypothetical protein [Dysgonamonadaceae bacterium]